jgi:acyl-CoA dehydrogenase
LSDDLEREFLGRIEHVARQTSAAHADEVDRDARFPHESLAALRDAGALSALVPARLGGAGVSFGTIADACTILGRSCGASAMVFAMHQIQVACILRHSEGNEWFGDYVGELVRSQPLIASATSEVGTGGDLGSSVAAVTEADGGLRTFEKQAPTISYGSHADALLTTLKRSPESDGGDQVAVLTLKDQTSLEQTGTWDPFGMRGTCSPGFVVRATFDASQVLPVPFKTISAETMVPVSHILWSHLWLGIAADAFERAQAFVRASAKRAAGTVPPAAERLSALLSQLSLLRAEVRAAREDYVNADANGGDWLSTVGAALRFNSLKIAASEQAARVCLGAMDVSGIVGFKNDTPYSVGRHIRDALSGPLMIANDRIHRASANLLLVAKEV